MNDSTKRIEKDIRKRIALRLSEGWSLEKIGHRTAWTMYGHPYKIQDGVLMVKMHNGYESFGAGR